MAELLSPALPWVFAGILVVIHWFGKHLNDTTFAHQEKLTSFSAGVTVTYIFLQLLPEFHRGSTDIGVYGAFPLLMGFSAVHVMEKYVYQHEKSLTEIRNDFRELHSVFLFLYYTAIGLLLYELVLDSPVTGTLFFIPVLFHTAISSFSLIELEEELLANRLVRGLITVAALIGVTTGNIVNIPSSTFYAVLGLVTGMFLYIAVHDSMPQRDAGAPQWFVLGLAAYSLVMVYVWSLPT